MTLNHPLTLARFKLPVLFLSIVVLSYTAQAEDIWTEDRSIQRALDISPQMKEAHAGLQSREGELQQAGSWPNPTISVRAQNRLGLQDGTGGYNADQLVVSQPLPLWRMQHQQEVARQQLAGEHAMIRQSNLMIQADVARMYQALLLNYEKLALAEQRMHFTDSIISAKQNSQPVLQYINPLDRLRIDLLHETSTQNVYAARAKFRESLALFRSRLDLPEQQKIELPHLQTARNPESLQELEVKLVANSQALQQLQHQLQAGQSAIALEQVKKYGDPVLSLIHERDVLAGRRQNFNGVMISVPVPLWDQNEGNIAKAQAELVRNESRLMITRRNLLTRLQQDYLQLTHLLNRVQHFNQQLVKPAEQLLKLTHRSYEVGELSSLNYIDAHKTYFDARNRYLDLVFQTQLKQIDLFEVIGEPLLDTPSPVEVSQQ